jgi:hypothetical protein
MFQGSRHLPTMMSELGRTTGDENTIAPVPYCHTFGVDDDVDDEACRAGVHKVTRRCFSGLLWFRSGRGRT